MRAIVVVAVGVSLLSACTTTPASRRQAAELAQRVAVYQEEQRQRVDGLNQRYRRSQARLMEALARYNEDELQQTLHVDAQRTTGPWNLGCS